ncbi:pentraxin-4 [Eudromia elegans]
MLPTRLLLAAVCLQGSLPQAPRPGPLLQRLGGLEEQFRRFREVTLTQLQAIAGNYNISYNIDARFRALAAQDEVTAAALRDTQATLRAELARAAAAARRLRRRVRRLEGRVAAWGQRQEPQEPLANRTRGPAGLGAGRRRRLRQERQHLREGARPGVPAWETQGQVSPREPPEPLQPHGPHAEQRAAGSPPKPKKLQAWHRRRERLREEGERPPNEARSVAVLREAALQRGDAAPTPPAMAQMLPSEARIHQEQPPATEQPDTTCGAGSVLLFPNSSVENVAVLGAGLRAGLRALSLCAWLSTPAPYLGTLLSYATEENDNKLVLHGWDRGLPGSMHFVIGDPEFRELPVTRLLDGKWHHLCLTWSSEQGKFRFYVDRRLLAAGSGFQQGYEIPAGGSLVLGQEQDELGGGFDPSEAFVGRLASLALWSRALTPGEVASLATGQGQPPGALLTLADASPRGWVRRAECACLERCP